MRRFGLGMMITGWLLIGGLIWWAMSGWESSRENPNAHLVSVQPGRGERVVLRRNASGHFVAPGRINGVEVVFLVDTGATDVAMPASVADRVGARRGLALRTQTAAGETVAYATQLDSVSLGGLEGREVRGLIVPEMQGDGVLLGMSFLSRFAIAMKGGELQLHLP